jgi:hypothetical protein
MSKYSVVLAVAERVKSLPDNRSIDPSPEFDRAGDFLRYRERNRALSNQIVKSLHAETADIDFAFAVDDLLRQRLPDRRRVFESMA